MSLDGTKMRAPAKSARIAFGALVIKERLGCSDEEVVDAILENPYLQHFLGLQEFRDTLLFNPSMMVHFRARFKQADHEIINAKIIALATAAESQGSEAHPAQADYEDDKEPPSAPPNSGKLLMDATCTPADITYPTDLKLLGEAREKTEAYLDKLHAPFVGKAKKPRTYR